jgi:hypothetical protein
LLDGFEYELPELSALAVAATPKNSPNISKASSAFIPSPDTEAVSLLLSSILTPFENVLAIEVES